MQNSKNFDFLVFIGRFQPLHLGHLETITTALGQAVQLIILCGSSHQPRAVRNPWTFPEREAMIRGTLSDTQNERVHIAPLMDTVYNDEAWVKNVQATVSGLVTAHFETPHRTPRIGLVGHSKDHTSYYLNLFPQWGSVDVPSHGEIAATDVRAKLFAKDAAAFLSNGAADLLPAAVIDQLDAFIRSEVFKSVKAEQEFVARYQQAWEAAPYPPTFVTVDAVVVQSGHVLMIERKARPGMGLLALPGGFVDHNERLVDACLRELREETRLKIPAPVLKGSIRRQEVFDAPHRSARGRTITHAFYIELAPNKELPKVKGSDDARHALWVPLAELNPNNIFEDHYFIIQEMIGM